MVANTIITNGAERSYKTHITMEGQPIGMFYGFKVIGMVTEADMAGIQADDAVYKANGNKFPEGYKIKKVRLVHCHNLLRSNRATFILKM